MRSFSRTLALCLGFTLALQATVGIPDSVLIVTKKETKLRTAKRLYAPAVCELREGDILKQLAKEGAWYSASYKAQTGWIHESDVSDRKDVRLSGEGVRETYSAAETAAAKKGFNREIEGDYKKTNPALAKMFQVVDQIQARVISESELVRFLRDGRILKE